MADSVPPEVVPVSVVIALYSTLCLSLSVILAILLFRSGEKTSYITITAGLLSVSTLVSIIQQIHYAVRWRVIRQAAFDQSKLIAEFPGIAISGVAEKGQTIMFRIQFYCYNVIALWVMFWCLTLFLGTWKIKSPRLAGFEDAIAWTCKLLGLLLPALFQGIARIAAVEKSLLASIIFNNLLMGISFAVGSVTLILTLYKYLENKRKLKSIESSSHRSGEITVERAQRREERQRRRDEQWLIIRFTIAFFFLAIWEVLIFVYELVQANANQRDAVAINPDYTPRQAKADLLFFLPGVSASLVYWLVFGTTAQFRKEYLKGFKRCCCCCFRRKSGSSMGSRTDSQEVELTAVSQRFPSVSVRQDVDVDKSLPPPLPDKESKYEYHVEIRRGSGIN